MPAMNVPRLSQLSGLLLSNDDPSYVRPVNRRSAPLLFGNRIIRIFRRLRTHTSDHEMLFAATFASVSRCRFCFDRYFCRVPMCHCTTVGCLLSFGFCSVRLSRSALSQ